jgi:hypothetical protein
VTYSSIPGIIAGETLATNQFRAVKFAATGVDNTVVPIAAITDIPLGIQQDTPDAAGQGVDVAYTGHAKAEYGGTIDAGDKLGVDSVGRVIVIAAGGDTTQFYIGDALYDGVVGDIRHILISRAGRAA